MKNLGAYITFIIILIAILLTVYGLMRWSRIANECINNGGEFAKHGMEWKCYY